MDKESKIVALVIIGILAIFGIIIWATLPKVYSIHGPVVNKFVVGPGYKVSSEAHIVIYSDSLKRNIDIDVTWNTYANAEMGKVLYFNLTERQFK